jgi:hypothetical protein
MTACGDLRLMDLGVTMPPLQGSPSQPGHVFLLTLQGLTLRTLSILLLQTPLSSM